MWENCVHEGITQSAQLGGFGGHVDVVCGLFVGEPSASAASLISSPFGFAFVLAPGMLEHAWVLRHSRGRNVLVVVLELRDEHA
jgi:hypothetical protein